MQNKTLLENIKQQNEIRRVLSPLNLTGLQYIALDYIGTRDNTTAKDVVDYVKSDKSTISSMFKRLKKAGLIEHVENRNDFRFKLILLTNEGQILLEKARKEVDLYEQR